MHPKFYHWHNRVELKPDPVILQARWDAAAKFAENLSPDDTCSLLRVAMLGADTPEFAKRFSDALVTSEPTFLPEGNAELLRVMATAALYSLLTKESAEADAVALGVRVATFQPDRLQLVSNELTDRAGEHLAKESDRVRPTPNVAAKFRALKKATEIQEWGGKPETPQLIGNAVLELGDTMSRISEENQFVWWLLSHRSSRLNARREKLPLKSYALIAAVEAAERVVLLPPPASVESLLLEVLEQCSGSPDEAIPLVEFVNTAPLDQIEGSSAVPNTLCPISKLLDIRRTGGELNDAAIAKLALPLQLNVSASDAAVQYYREVVFLRALKLLA